MTNGEKIKVAFPHYDIEIDEHKGYVRVFYEDFYTTYPLRWWNAEYKEPTTKNGISNRTIIYKAKESKEIQKDLDKLSEINKTTTKNDCETCIHNKGVLECDMYGCKYEPTTKNDLGVDCVARQDIERYIEGFINEYTPKEELEFINLELDGLKHLPSVTPQEPRIDFEELKRKILMEVDGGTDDAWLAYGEVCDSISNSINEFVADMREVEG